MYEETIYSFRIKCLPKGIKIMSMFFISLVSAFAYVLLFVNIVFICNIILGQGNGKINRLEVVVLSLFVISSVLLPFLYNFRFWNSFSALGMPTYYLMLFIAIRLITKTKISRILYVCLLIIYANSLLGSSLVMLFNIINFTTFDEKFTCAIVSILFNLSCILIISLIRRQKIFINIQKTSN
jgi:hypothetical protein